MRLHRSGVVRGEAAVIRCECGGRRPCGACVSQSVRRWASQATLATALVEPTKLLRFLLAIETSQAGRRHTLLALYCRAP